MLNAVTSTSSIGWTQNIPAGLYLYVAIGGFLVVILFCVLWLLNRKRKHKNKFTAQKNPTISRPLHSSEAVSFSSVYEKIASLGGHSKSILLAGAGLECLPITIPVQTAVQLAQTGKKVLLIDLDTRRNAAARVFDLNETTLKNTTRPSPLPTSVENLSLWPAEFFVRSSQMNLRQVIQSATEHFEIILINTPYLDGHPDRKLIASCAKHGLIFCKTTQQFERLRNLLVQGECKLMEEKPVNG